MGKVAEGTAAGVWEMWPLLLMWLWWEYDEESLAVIRCITGLLSTGDGKLLLTTAPAVVVVDDDDDCPGLSDRPTAWLLLSPALLLAPPTPQVAALRSTELLLLKERECFRLTVCCCCCCSFSSTYVASLMVKSGLFTFSRLVEVFWSEDSVLLSTEQQAWTGPEGCKRLKKNYQVTSPSKQT
jgi:hypothetical protein